MTEAATLLGRMVARRYVIEAHIGSGAMGDVYRARHVDLPIEIALKIMRPTIAQDELFQKRFYREAKAASRLEHPNSVRVIDFGKEDDGLVYLAMEFLRGRDLLTLLKEEWPLDDKRVVDILAQTLSALSLAHGLGIVHRDLKPENIMIVPDEDDDRRDHVKVCDFGIAKLNDPRAFDSKDGQGKALTTSGALIGTPEYMSPEQARGDPLDARSDLYAIGVILYQLLTGAVPFTAENTLGVVIKQVTEEPLPPSRLRASVNPLLEQVCLRAMRKKVDERYQSAKEMRNDLRAALGIRAPAPSSSDSQPTSLPRISDSAATLVDPRQSRRSGLEAASDRPVDFERKDTQEGTEIVLPVSSNGRIVGVVVAVLAIAAAIAFVLVRPTSSGAEQTGAKLVASIDSSAPTETAVTPAPMLPSSTSDKRAVVPQPPNGRPTAARPGTSAPPAPTPIEAPRSTTPTPAPSPTVAPAPTTPAPAASYNAMGAFVALDSLTTERVHQDAVRKKMGELVPKLTECYRNALLVVGAPVGGSAGIHLSIDGTGRMQAVVTANQLPPFQRCAAQAVQGHSVPASALDGSGGATAEQWLKLNP